MPEIKNQFTGGKMNKDLDERIVPQGQYRDGMNIQVSTSEGSDVGTVQNILGNKQVSLLDNFILPDDARTIGCISDEKNDTLYYLVWTSRINYIISYSRNDAFAIPVFVDNKGVLEFKIDTYITGINIIDDMLLWTDNKTEPKKINILRCKEGTVNFVQHTRLINITRGINIASNQDIETSHITVIKKCPKTALKINLNTARKANKIYTGVITITNFNEPNVVPEASHPFGAPTGNDINSFNYSSFVDAIFTQNPIPNQRYDFSGITTEKQIVGTSLDALRDNNIFGVKILTGLDSAGQEVALNPINSLVGGLSGWHHPAADLAGFFAKTNIALGTKVVLKPYDGVNPPGLPVTDYVIKGEISDRYPLRDASLPQPNPPGWNTDDYAVNIKVTAIDGTPPVVPDGAGELKYVIDLFDDTEKLFEFKFPRFSYRYKYSDGEYSTFAPWTQVAFQPGPFDYHPRKGYNLGMTNRIQSVDLFGLVTAKTPKDVVSVDVLFKDEPSPNIYVVDTIRKDDTKIGSNNKWNSILNNNSAFNIEKETINSVVPSNQLLRPWDNVPRKALAQDVTGNRIVYGNYIQNYDIKKDNSNYTPNFLVNWVEFPEANPLGINTRLSQSGKSIKSLREYQLGVVFVDQHGRETPVISNESGTIKLGKQEAANYNRLDVNLGVDPDGYPNSIDNHLRYFKFYIKETSGEYYNMAMDRFYDAKDGNIWLAFPSSDRNKIDIDSFLILKKGSDESELVTDPARYKVIAIENEAPDFIKTRKTLAAKVRHSFNSSNPNSISDIFGGGIGSGPAQGRNQFEINYKPFSATSAANINEYTAGELHLEFENPTTNQTSERYRISSIDHDFDSTAGGANAGTDVISLNDAKFYINLEDAFGADINFITDDPTGANSSLIANGVEINIYKHEITNSPKFDGRFFVKIYSDDVFAANIGKSFEEGLDYRVLNSKMVYYMHPDHRIMHTENHDNFLTNGATTSLGSSVDNFLDDTPFCDWGYYAVREFASMALFFRRYARGVSTNAAPGQTSGLFSNLGNPWSFTPAQPFNVLAHLKKGNGGDSSPSASTLDVAYQNTENWTPADDWFKEWGEYSTSSLAGSNIGYTHNFYYEQNVSFSNGISTLTSSSIPADVILEKITNDITDQNTRDTEIWFIDGGDYAGKTSHISRLNWDLDPTSGGGLIAHYEDYKTNTGGLELEGSQQWGNDSSVIPPLTQNHPDLWSRQSGGIEDDGPTTHKMQLAFGGIMGASKGNGIGGDTESFWNVGNWGTGSSTPLNPSYTDIEPFTNNMNGGYKFRWRQDPTKQIYTIGNSDTYGLFRHSSIRQRSYEINWKNKTWGWPAVDGNYGMVQNNAIWKDSSNTIITGQYHGGTSMAENLSFNFSKNWNLNNIFPQYSLGSWDPLTAGEIPNGYVINLTCCTSTGNSANVIGPTAVTTATGAIGDDLQIYVTSLVGSAGNFTSGLDSYRSSSLLTGMALESYTIQGNTSSGTVFSQNGNQAYLVIRKIEKDPTGNFFILTLGGYTKAFVEEDHEIATNATGIKNPAPGTLFRFVQVGMNGYSSNSEFNINTLAYSGSVQKYGAVTAVGYELEFIEFIEPEEILSENPAVWETEPKDIKELDIYYEATAGIPMEIDADTVESAFPINSYIQIGSTTNMLNVVGYVGSNVIVKATNALTGPTPYTVFVGGLPVNVKVFRLDGIEFDVDVNVVQDITYLGSAHGQLEFVPKLFNRNYKLDWHNCYSFGNGVESNRIRDNFNLPFIVNGVKVSTTLEHEYKEEHRKYGLIYSGIYNSTSGLNNLNQFIQAEKITKDVNPIYGSIQKLHSRDTDLVTLCEDKCLRIMANKDAVFNADGNTNLTATANVLGQTFAFSGEYGISTNPESFASEAYRAYFTDKVRGKVMRLSKDGLTPISDAGMKDWFKDNLKISNTAIGSYDDKKDQYNLTLANKPTCYKVTFKSTLQSIAASLTKSKNVKTDTNSNFKTSSYKASGPVTSGISGSGGGIGTGGGGGPLGGGFVLGCTDPTASNYNSLATLDNFSCVYNQPNPGCTDPNAINYDPTATLDDGSCIVAIGTGGGGVLGGGVLVPGCMDVNANNYSAIANFDDGSCSYSNINAIGPCPGPYYPTKTFIADSEIFQINDPVFGQGIPLGSYIAGSEQQPDGKWHFTLDLFHTPPKVDEFSNSYYCGVQLTPQQILDGNKPDCSTCWDVVICTSDKNVPVKTITYKEDVKGWVSFKSFFPEQAISMANDYYTFDSGKLWMHHDSSVDRNTFYGNFTSSSVNVILNQQPGSVKSFTTLNYEGSKSRVTTNLLDDQYYNLADKNGWYVNSIFTNKETGSLEEFIEKEGKWFNYIKGDPALHGFDGKAWDSAIGLAGINDANITMDPDGESSWDQDSFAIQGLGMYNVVDSTSGCTDPSATNYDVLANVDDGSCRYPVVYGCTDSNASNYNDLATNDDDSCIYNTLGCTDNNAANYDASATIDDGSCVNSITTGCIECGAYNGGGGVLLPRIKMTGVVLGIGNPQGITSNPMVAPLEWMIANAPNENVNNYYYESVQANLAGNVAGTNGGYYRQLNGITVRINPTTISNPPIYSWSNIVSWVNLNGCPGANVGMQLMELDTHIYNCPISTQFPNNTGYNNPDPLYPHAYIHGLDNLTWPQYIQGVGSGPCNNIELDSNGDVIFSYNPYTNVSNCTV